MAELAAAAVDYGMDVLLEVHDRHELERALAVGPRLIGINNRNLDTMDVDVEHALRLAPELPMDLISVAESAISDTGDVTRVAEAGFDAVLVGTALVTSEDPGSVLRDLVDIGNITDPAPRLKTGLIELADIEDLADIEELSP